MGVSFSTSNSCINVKLPFEKYNFSSQRKYSKCLQSCTLLLHKDEVLYVRTVGPVETPGNLHYSAALTWFFLMLAEGG